MPLFPHARTQLQHNVSHCTCFSNHPNYFVALRIVLRHVLVCAADAELNSAAQRLRGLVDALPELPDEVQGALAMRVPGLLDLPPEEVRQRLETLSKTLELDFIQTSRLVGKVGAHLVQ